MSRARKSPRSFVVSSSVVLGLVIAVLWAVPPRAFAQVQETPARPPADPADVATIDAIISASYEVIFGPAGERDWDRERSLFHPGSRHMPTRPNQRGGSNVNVTTVEDFIDSSRQFYAQTGFYEYEIARTTQRFGDIAHVFSTYEWSTVKDGPVQGRGINSFQLLWDGERWWIVSVYWAQETEDDPIPAEFLPADTVEVVGAGVVSLPDRNETVPAEDPRTSDLVFSVYGDFRRQTLMV